MNKFKFLPILFFFAVIAASCDDDDSGSSDTQAVAEEVASTVSSSNSGVSAEMNTATHNYEASSVSYSYNYQKDTVYSDDATFVMQSLSGTVVAFYFTYQANFGLVYEEVAPDNFYFNSLVDGYVEGPKYSSTSNRQSHWILTGLASSQSSYVLNGTIERIGNSEIEGKVINSTSDIEANGVKIDKGSDEILEGSLDWKITGTIDGESFSYNVVLIYEGNNRAKLTILNDEYYVNLETGELED